jgi:hypothetical protein
MSNRTLIVAVMFAAVVFGAFAEVDGHDRSLEEVTSEIRNALSLDMDEKIDPDAVPEDLLIALGDAVMGTYVNDPEQHEWMDQMMGGGMTGSAGMMGSGWGLMGNPDRTYNRSLYESPEEVLERRYASGEISRRQYRRMHREIE